MKPKLFLCLALALTGGLSGHAQTAASMVIGTNLPQTYVTLKSNWTDLQVTLYRATGGTVQLDAKEAVVTEYEGQYHGRFLYTNDFAVIAFVDPETGNAWLGSSIYTSLIQPQAQFYLETKSGIVCGHVFFLAMELGAVMPYEHDVINGEMASGEISWFDSLVPSVKAGENVDALIGQFKGNGGSKWMTQAKNSGQGTIIQNGMYRIDNGLNPWLFVDERNGPQFAGTVIEAIDVDEGTLHLDLKGPDGKHAKGSSGVHTASVWINLKTWKVVKTIQDGQP